MKILPAGTTWERVGPREHRVTIRREAQLVWEPADYAQAQVGAGHGNQQAFQQAVLVYVPTHASPAPSWWDIFGGPAP